MKSIGKFLDKLTEEAFTISEEDVDDAKEEALSFVAEFVKDVKKRFPKKEDKMVILEAAQKTLKFFIEEIEKDEMEMPFETPAPFEAPAEAGVGTEPETETEVEV